LVCGWQFGNGSSDVRSQTYEEASGLRVDLSGIELLNGR
jgi:hypothetical protein